MGRGRGKGKKISIIDYANGDEEKVPVKRRGRPTKALKEELKQIEEEDEKDFIDNDVKDEAPLENEKKRKKPSLNLESMEENGLTPKMNGHDLAKSVGFRQNGSRRKNKPRRAAEVGVECI